MTDSVFVPGQPPAEAPAFSWTGSSQAPAQAAPTVGALDPDVAVRARLSAIMIDSIIVGIPIILFSVPCYYGMQLAERLATRETRDRDAQLANEP